MTAVKRSWIRAACGQKNHQLAIASLKPAQLQCCGGAAGGGRHGAGTGRAVHDDHIMRTSKVMRQCFCTGDNPLRARPRQEVIDKFLANALLHLRQTSSMGQFVTQERAREVQGEDIVVDNLPARVDDCQHAEILAAWREEDGDTILESHGRMASSQHSKLALSSLTVWFRVGHRLSGSGPAARIAGRYAGHLGRRIRPHADGGEPSHGGA